MNTQTCFFAAIYATRSLRATSTVCRVLAWRGAVGAGVAAGLSRGQCERGVVGNTSRGVDAAEWRPVRADRPRYFEVVRMRHRAVVVGVVLTWRVSVWCVVPPAGVDSRGVAARTQIKQRGYVIVSSFIAALGLCSTVVAGSCVVA